MTERVVVVDDSDDYRLLVRLALDGNSGFEVVAEAATVAAGVEECRRLQPDLVLLDLVMPPDDVIASIPAFHAASARSALVVVSAFPDHELSAVAATGSLAHLSKDVPPSRIAAELALVTGVLGAADAARRTASTRLAADARSAATARHFVDTALRSWDCNDLLDVVTLLVSELVTNAVIHAGSEVEVEVRLAGGRVRVDVVDRSTEVVKRRDAEDDDQSGRGMDLVEALASAWGIDLVPGGKSVWFEIERPAEVESSGER